MIVEKTRRTLYLLDVRKTCVNKDLIHSIAAYLSSRHRKTHIHLLGLNRKEHDCNDIQTR